MASTQPWRQHLILSTLSLSLMVSMAILATPGAAQTLPEPVYTVVMEAELDPDSREVRGSKSLVWTNRASVPLTDLQFHLYLNAFANNRSTFMIESGGRHRSSEFDDQEFGFCEVLAITADGVDLLPGQEFLAPDDGNVYDRTVVRYPLPEPLAPGAQIRLEIDFLSRLPDIFARTGMHGEYVLAGQWFPKIAVFEDTGDRGRKMPGWNAHQFHLNSEFYADFGDWDVTLTLPERYAGKIGATGRRQSADVADGKVTERYVQRGVHDFAWTADPLYEVVEARFDPAADVPAAMLAEWSDILGLPESELALTPVDIELFIHPENLTQADRYIESAKAGIRGYGIRLGAYPYDTLTLVDPAAGAGGSGGMEYPTFITLGTHPILNVAPFRGILAPELVTVHEFGHQYFQGMIANNEFEEAWIDEGINSYYEMEVMEDEYPWNAHLPGVFRASAFEMNHSSVAGGDFSDIMAAPAWRYMNRGRYGRNSYPRPAVTLRHLSGVMGEETFHRAMRYFFQTYQFQHPTTADFERALEESSGQDLDWVLSQALHSSRPLDYGIRSLEVARVSDRAGFFWRDGERTELGMGDDGESVSEEDDHALYRSTVVVYRWGEFIHPVTVEFRFEGGRVERREWDGDRRWARFTFTDRSKIESAEVDPDQVLALDVNRLNNGRSREPDSAPATSFFASILYWLQNLFQTASVLA
ncbi:MAG: M1 family metallopeptidase [Acidobacteriota bacterium]